MPLFTHECDRCGLRVDLICPRADRDAPKPCASREAVVDAARAAQAKSATSTEGWASNNAPQADKRVCRPLEAADLLFEVVRTGAPNVPNESPDGFHAVIVSCDRLGMLKRPEEELEVTAKMAHSWMP